MQINLEKRHLYILAGLIILASVGYVIAQTPGVSHHPAEITPQGSGSGLDADKLDGVDSSGFMRTSASGLVVGGGAETYTDGIYSCYGGWGAVSCPYNNRLTCSTGTKRETSQETTNEHHYLCIT